MGVRDGFLEWWAPDIHSAEPFPLDLPEFEGAAQRCPSQKGAGDYFASEEPSPQSEAEESESNLHLSD